MVTSGLRIGTPALATRGFTAVDFQEVADVVATALLPGYDESVATVLRKRVDEVGRLNCDQVCVEVSSNTRAVFRRREAESMHTNWQ